MCANLASIWKTSTRAFGLNVHTVQMTSNRSMENWSTSVKNIQHHLRTLFAQSAVKDLYINQNWTNTWGPIENRKFTDVPKKVVAKASQRNELSNNTCKSTLKKRFRVNYVTMSEIQKGTYSSTCEYTTKTFLPIVDWFFQNPGNRSRHQNNCVKCQAHIKKKYVFKRGKHWNIMQSIVVIFSIN